LLLAYIVFVFVATNFVSLLFMFFVTIVVVVMSKIQMKLYLKNLKTILPIIIFTSILNAVYVSTGSKLFEFWIVTVTTGGVSRAAFMCLRIIMLIITSALLSYTTTPTALADGIERLLLPLKFIGLEYAVHTMAMMMTIALRFIPILIEETDKIMSAQKARGADMESGGLIKRVRSLLPVLIPLLLSSVRRAVELADAMECRCYNGGKGRQRMKQFKLAYLDYISIVFIIVVCGLVILFNILW